MRKNLLILTAVLAVSYSCSNDEVVETAATSDSNAISFRPLTTGVTRATATTLSTIESNGFYVGAWYNSSHTSYFADVQFTKDADATTYHSTSKYYWPAEGNLDFVAYYPNVGGQLTHGTWDTFTLAPASDISTHNDYLLYSLCDCYCCLYICYLSSSCNNCLSHFIVYRSVIIRISNC